MKVLLAVPGTGKTTNTNNIFALVDENTKSRVKIMSIYKSKGLGAEHVFMIGLVKGIIPNRVRENDTIESQLRLFYVGMKRAKKSLHLLSSINLEGRYAFIVNKDEFKFDVRSRLWKIKKHPVLLKKLSMNYDFDLPLAK